ncbi:MAG: hypothetical protein EHM45_16275, partial [Desulfobacteraceae bacterium]
MDKIAESYVKLVLAMTPHDPDYVDAYLGPPQWKTEIEAAQPSLALIKKDADTLLNELAALSTSDADELPALRKKGLTLKLEALIARIEILEGKRFSFNDEARALYGVTPPTHSPDFFQNILGELEHLLPGQGPLEPRYHAFRKVFVIPPEKLDVVFQVAIAECRSRTAQHLELPKNESFLLEYVRNKPWSGYNWYKGTGQSLIQINTDLPIYIDRAVDLAAHEGYPGHHVYHSLNEKIFVQQLHWAEYRVYALFTYQALVAEGSANFGILMIFPGQERLEFERDRLYPLAGLDPAQAPRYNQVQALFNQLNYSHNEAARQYLDGNFNRSQAVEYLVRYALFSPERADQRLRFIDTYRSYVINYNLG